MTVFTHTHTMCTFEAVRCESTQLIVFDFELLQR